MLGRLIKYDMKSVSRLGLPMSAIVLVVSIMGAIALKIVENAPDNASGIPLAVCTMFVVAAFIAIFAYMVVVWILLIHRFYTNMFTDEGYLTFTLPVKPRELILSKLVSAMAWTVVTFLVGTLCVFILLTFGTGSGLASLEWLMDIRKFIAMYMPELNAWHIILGLVYLLVASVFTFLVIYLSVTIASVITRKNKILVAIGLYYGINMMVSLFTTIGELIPMAMVDSLPTVAEAVSEYFITISINTCIYALFSLMAFVLCNQLMKRKLNLD